MSDSPTFRLETLVVQGSPGDLGRGQGEAFRERIQRFVEMRFEAMKGYFADRGRPTEWTQVIDAGRAGLGIYETWDKDGHDELKGIAEGSGIDFDRLFTATNMTDFRDAVLLKEPAGEPLQKLNDEGCSSVLVPTSASSVGYAIAGQTWDLNPPDIEYVVAIRRKPNEGPETWSVTCAGCLTLMGINEYGLAVGTTNIKTYGSRPGVGYLSILHRAVRAMDVSEARELVRKAPHSGAHTYWLADESQQIEYEASPNGQFLRTTEDGPIFRTNHCITPEHVAVQGEVVGESSTARFARLGEILSEPANAASLRTLFSDRSDGVRSINRYEEDGMGTATNAVFIAEPAKRRASACRGPADRGEWIDLTFD